MGLYRTADTCYLYWYHVPTPHSGQCKGVRNKHTYHQKLSENLRGTPHVIWIRGYRYIVISTATRLIQNYNDGICLFIQPRHIMFGNSHVLRETDWEHRTRRVDRLQANEILGHMTRCRPTLRGNPYHFSLIRFRRKRH